MLEPVRSAQVYLFDNGYAEGRSFMTRTRSGVYQGDIPSELRFQATDRFRLDLFGTGTVRFGNTLTTQRLSLFHKDIRTYAFDPTRIPMNGVTVDADGRLHFSAEADPYLDVTLSQLPLVEEQRLGSWVLPVLIVILLAFPFLLYSWYATLRRHYLLVMAAAAFCCLVAMLAVGLPLHHGPDETLHVASGAWYVDHVFPPSVGDPSVYYDSFFGVNYIIGYTDLTYLLTFKTAVLLEGLFPLPLHERARLAQVAIFAVLFLGLLRFVSARTALTLLLSVAVIPQAAYLLTYVNGDALSYCLAVAALAVLGSRRTPAGWVVAMAFFVLANLKTQYLILLPAAVFLLYRRSEFQYARWAAAGFALGLYRHVFNVYDQVANQITFKANHIQHAGPLIRERIENGFWDPSPIFRPDFYIYSAKSLYAVFGAMNFQFALPVYVAAAVLACILLWNNGRMNAVVAGVFGLNLAASLWFSITYHYQPQGRYLLPAAALAFVVFADHGQFRRIAPFALVTVFCLLKFAQTAA
jgi:hypothetical protein